MNPIPVSVSFPQTSFNLYLSLDQLVQVSKAVGETTNSPLFWTFHEVVRLPGEEVIECLFKVSRFKETIFWQAHHQHNKSDPKSYRLSLAKGYFEKQLGALKTGHFGKTTATLVRSPGLDRHHVYGFAVKFSTKNLPAPRIPQPVLNRETTERHSRKHNPLTSAPPTPVETALVLMSYGKHELSFRVPMSEAFNVAMEWTGAGFKEEKGGE